MNVLQESLGDIRAQRPLGPQLAWEGSETACGSVESAGVGFPRCRVAATVSAVYAGSCSCPLSC